MIRRFRRFRRFRRRCLKTMMGQTCLDRSWQRTPRCPGRCPLLLLSGALVLSSGLDAPLLPFQLRCSTPLALVFVSLESKKCQDWAMTALVAAAKPKVAHWHAKVLQLHVAVIPEFAAAGNQEADAVIIIIWAQELFWLDLLLRIRSLPFDFLKGLAQR